ncbi:MAG: DUF4097 family beta strand repeat protein [Actinobacteria bacterium]|nr:DUF4097 family beta strand repeat protein [Actinomycetota bacterium]
MSRWTIDAPTTLDFDGIAALRVRAISGSVAVLSTDDQPRLDISRVTGQPLQVTHEAGILTVTYPDLSWEGLLGWLRPAQHSAAITVMVPKDCPTQLGVVNAVAVVSGITARTSVKSVAGNITLDGVTGAVDADTVSGDVEAQGLAGRIGFKSVSGDLTLADGSVERMDAKSISGRVTADVDLIPDSLVRVATVSGEVTIRLPASASARVELKSATGRVLTEFGGMDCSRVPGANSAAGQLGSGSGKLSVTTVSGRVALLGRHEPSPPPAGGTQPEADAP